MTIYLQTMSLICVDFQAIAMVHRHMDNAIKSTTLPISPATVRYIKLGPGNAWFPQCRRLNNLEFGHSDIDHYTAQSGDREKIASAYKKLGRSKSKASDFAREVVDFFTLGADCLWITIADGSLWWAFAEPEVHPIANPSEEGSVRYRNIIGKWSNTDINGNVLSLISLSSVLTKVAAYRQTLCEVEASDYLIRRINAVEPPLVAKAKSYQNDLVNVTAKIITELHWRDFEVLCDLIFARSGWQRVAEIGGLQKDTDLVLEQIATGERAFVQVKSKSDRVGFQDYVARFIADPGFARMFYCCHSPSNQLSLAQLDTKCAKPIHVWSGNSLARQALAAGLTDWILQKAS